ncbi:MAG: UDP-N-acetylmuramoyl-tripeptide--D-alanyl-D-alanine ligase [candidate division WS2 bacterium]|nr:UDP-N-acetylmuramoyl-tripeptide--D-alanyl-D-alanine ligase [Candidatus Lithacetigena glycinireducens]MBT9175059.1 UDP-N-acetylmuramoyl-tripeptide--D-alanyl-D-alanine ligase [Candidatus Lithacetigena glycinireducens]
MLIEAGLLNQIVSGKLIGDEGISFSHYVSDSREAREGSFFVALKGENTDGHLFCADAQERGAKGALLKEKMSVFPLEIIVENTLSALIILGKWVSQKNPTFTIGVGGSVGKTTTKEMIREVLSCKYQVSATPGNMNTEIGIPLYLLNDEENPQVRVVEYGAQKIGDLNLLVDIIKPSAAIITALGPSHTEYFGSLEGVKEEEGGVLLKSISETGWVVLNADDKLVMSLGSSCLKKIITYGYKGRDFRMKKINSSLEGTEIIASTPEGGVNYFMKDVMGKHMAMNSLGALAIGFLMGIPPLEGTKALTNFKPIWGRMEKKQCFGATLLVDYYNSNSLSLKASLELFSNLEGKRKILILGEMRELGLLAEEEHRKFAPIIEGLAPQVLITVGENARLFRSKGTPGNHFNDSKMAGRWLKENLKPDDLVLIKGSRGVNMEEILKVLNNGI